MLYLGNNITVTILLQNLAAGLREKNSLVEVSKNSVKNRSKNNFGPLK